MSATADPRDALPADDMRPVVAPPRVLLSGPLIFAICVGLAILLFLMLDARRRALVAARERPGTATAPAPVTPLAVPPAPVPAPPPAPVVVQQPTPPAPRPAPSPAFVPTPQPVPQFAPPPAPPQQTQARREGSETPMVMDFTSGSATTTAGGPGATGGDKGAAGSAPADNDAVRATLIRNRATLIPQGTLIPAVLETPLNSDRPGLVRALVTRDAAGFDGSRVLIPRGSRLIGEFKADANANQRRVLVTWTRLIRPDGVAIRLDSPATDRLGGSGVAGSVNTHFFERFANAVLQSALTIGVERASRIGNGSVIVGLPNQLGSVGQQLLPNIQPRTTVKVREGAEIAIFVARDLDFGGTPAVGR